MWLFDVGRIVNVSSLISQYSELYYSTYSMSKAAVTRFSETLRSEMKEFAVKVVTIMPGGYRVTELFEQTIQQMDTIWQNTDQSVGNSFGHNYYSDWRSRQMKRLTHPILGDNPYIVVNAMFEAITCCEPNETYVAIDGKVFAFYNYMRLYLPNCIQQLWALMENFV